MIDIRKLLTVMSEYKASDLYITVDSPPTYRVNGVVRPAGTRILSKEETELLALGVMTEDQQREFLSTNEMNLALFYTGLGRYRVNIFRQRGDVGMVIRKIESDIPKIEDLGLPSILKEISLAKRGLILVAGAAGSGKSTSLASMIDHRNANLPGHIITIEDPIEFLHAHKKSIITQREIGIDTESYGMALKNALRQTPDVVLIGEIRDEESMNAAISFAETGHLVMATIHSNNSNQVMERVMSFFPVERHKQIYLQLSLNLRAIISQRLVRTIENKRVPAVEILLNSSRISELVYKGEIHMIKEAMEKSTVVGMQTFDQHLYDLYSGGRISYDEALRNADSQNNLRLKIKLSEETSTGNNNPTDKKGENVIRGPVGTVVKNQSLTLAKEEDVFKVDQD